jgi:hypothetical protein
VFKILQTVANVKPELQKKREGMTPEPKNFSFSPLFKRIYCCVENPASILPGERDKKF